MRGLISMTALAATALLLAGCEKKADTANDSVNASLSAPTNGVDPDVDDNSFGVPDLGEGNGAQNSGDPAVNAAEQ